MPDQSHEFPGGAPRCIYCGTRAIHHAATPQPCPGPQVQRGEKLLPPLPDKQREYAANDVDAIQARLAELKAEQAAVRNLPPDEEGGIQH